MFCTGRLPQRALALLKRPHAGDEAVIDLLPLIAVHRVVQEEREVRDQVEVVAEAVGLDLLSVLPVPRCHSPPTL